MDRRPYRGAEPTVPPLVIPPLHREQCCRSDFATAIASKLLEERLQSTQTHLNLIGDITPRFHGTSGHGRYRNLQKSQKYPTSHRSPAALRQGSCRSPQCLITNTNTNTLQPGIGGTLAIPRQYKNPHHGCPPIAPPQKPPAMRCRQFFFSRLLGTSTC